MSELLKTIILAPAGGAFKLEFRKDANIFSIYSLCSTVPIEKVAVILSSIFTLSTSEVRLVATGLTSVYDLQNAEPPPSYEDFTTWTELPTPTAWLSQTEERSTFAYNDYRIAARVLLYKAKNQQNFTYKFELTVTQTENVTRTRRVNIFAASDYNRGWRWHWDFNDRPCIGVQLRTYSSTTTYFLGVVEHWKIGNQFGSWGPQTLNVGQTYYVKVEKSGTTWRFYVYQNSDYTNPVAGYDARALTLHGDWDLAYFMVPQSIGDASSGSSGGWVQKLLDVT